MHIADVKRDVGASARGRQRRIIAVIGSGKVADPCCAELGRLIATLGYDLLTGGGGGVMEAVSRAFSETSPRQGIVIGVIPAEVTPFPSVEDRTAIDVQYRPPPGYPNPWVELAVYTHLPDSGAQGTLRSSRNHINVLSADAIVALPGGEGTTSEMWLATRYGVPIIAYGAHERREDVLPGIALAQSLEEVRYFFISSASR